jgi:hypothetical protein
VGVPGELASSKPPKLTPVRTESAWTACRTNWRWFLRATDNAQRATRPAKRLGQPESISVGRHTTGVRCLYIKDLDKIDLSVLETIVGESYRTVTDGTYMLRAREGAPATPPE